MKYVLKIWFGEKELQIGSDHSGELDAVRDALKAEGAADDWHDVDDGDTGRTYHINCRSISYMELAERAHDYVFAEGM
jgi:hypothetical protein